MKTNFLFALLVWFLPCSSSASITTSFPILTLIVQELVDSSTPIRTLSQSGEDAHHFDLSPKSLIELQKQKLLIVNGLKLEHWIPAVKAKLSSKVRIVEATQGIKPILNGHQEPDPHAWHHPENLLIYIATIEQALIDVYPTETAAIKERANKLRLRITLWQKDTLQKFAKLSKPRLLVTAHDSFAYFAQAYDLDYLALLNDHSGEALSPKTLSRLLKRIKENNHCLFLGEGNQLDSQLKAWAQKSGSSWGGELWGDSLPPLAKKLTLMDYLNHNTSVVLEGFAPQPSAR